jgi:restriction endonuclease S subunit
MKKKLDELAEISYGTYDKPMLEGTHQYLVASHFDDFYELTEFADSFIDLKAKDKKFQLIENDVILAGKGSRNFAWAYELIDGPCVPSSLFYILRPKSIEILGKYLAYFLNSEKTQFALKNMATGRGMPSIPKKELIQLEIEVPPVAEQKRIIALVDMMDEEIQLDYQLITLKQQRKKGIINKMINKQ